MKIKEQTRKLAAGCSKHCFEVVDISDKNNHTAPFVDSLLQTYHSSSKYFEIQQFLQALLYSKKSIEDFLSKTIIYVFLEQKFMLFLILHDIEVRLVQRHF